MQDNNFNNIICSRNCKDFVLLFDGLGNYFLYYEDLMLLEFAEPLTPKQLYKDSDLLKPLQEIKDTNKIGLITSLIEQIIDIMGDDAKKYYIIQSLLYDLVNSLKDAETDQLYNKENFANAPQTILDKAREISSIKGQDAEVFDKLITPTSIEEEIQQRTNPILTNEQKAKADAIAEQVNKMGLLPYLNSILEPIHMGVHKNIYRKILAEFNIMSGKGSYLSETTAKAEQGKSFEDDIVFGLITPPQYIFEVNDITIASFVRFALYNPYYFSRLTIVFGDLGGDDSFKKVKPIFNAVKPMITEGAYTYIKSDQNNDTDIVQIPLKVDSIGAVYQTTKNSFTKDDDQLISRTIFSTPAKVDSKDICRQNHYLFDKRTRQSKAKADAEQKLKDFGLYLMQLVNSDVEIINPYIDVFLEYASTSDNPIREHKQQLELFNAYCILTQDKCKTEPMGTLFASEEQLKDYMDFVNLENALIPYEYDFINMLLAKDKAKELTILYNDFDLLNEDGELADIDLNEVTTLTECENAVIEVMNDKLQQRLDSSEDILQSKGDLNSQQLKELPQKLLAMYGFRSVGAKQRIFFRYNDIKNYYGKRTAYKNIDDVNQLLQSLHNKGYLGKYEYKDGKQNLYYLTPLCNNLTSDFELKKSYNEYVNDYFANTGYDNF